MKINKVPRIPTAFPSPHCIDEDYHEDLNYERTVALIEALKRGERPAPGSSIGRQTSAPEGGPIVLVEG